MCDKTCSTGPLGWVALGVGTVALVPQLWHTLRSGQTAGLSPASVIISILSRVLWIIYTAPLPCSGPLVTSSSIGIMLSLILLAEFYYSEWSAPHPVRHDETLRSELNLFSFT